MEGIGTLDMEAGIFYGTLRDGSHVSSMCIMEENLMASTSLLLALLEFESEQYQQATGALKGTLQIPRQDEYERTIKTDKEKQKKVQENLYKTLYVITEYPDLPQNKKLSMAIGRILARAIAEEIPAGEPQAAKEAFQELRQKLLLAVTDAIDEIKPSQA